MPIDQPISTRPSASALTVNDIFYVDQGGITKHASGAQVQALIGGSGSNSADDPPINFAFGDVTNRIIMPLTGAHVVQRVTIVVDTAFNGVNPSLSIGTMSVPDLLVRPERVDLTTLAEYEIGGAQQVASPDAIYLTLNAGMAATQGAGRILIERVPQN